MVMETHVPANTTAAAQEQVRKRKLETVEDTSEQTSDYDTQSKDDKALPIDQSQENSDTLESDSSVSSISSDKPDDDLGLDPDSDTYWGDLGDPMMSEQSESDSEPDGEFKGSEKPSPDEVEKNFLADESGPDRRIRQENVRTGIWGRYHLNGMRDHGKTDEELDQRRIVDWSKFDKWARWGMVEDEDGEYFYDKTTGTFRRPYGRDVFLASNMDEDGEAVAEADGKYGVKVGRRVKGEDGSVTFETDDDEKKEKKAIKKAAKKAAKKAKKEAKMEAKKESAGKEATTSTRKMGMGKRAKVTDADLNI